MGLSTNAGMQGFCYVKYTSPESAAAAIENLDGIEYPHGSGMKLKASSSP